MFHPCKYGCGVSVEVRKEPEGWRPFEESGEMHNCPKSPYNQQKKQVSEIDPDRLKGSPALEPQEKEKEKTIPRIRAPISLIKIISVKQLRELEDHYRQIVNKIIGDGGKIQGCQFQKDGDLWTICIYYEVPNTAVVGEVG